MIGPTSVECGYFFEKLSKNDVVSLIPPCRCDRTPGVQRGGSHKHNLQTRRHDGPGRSLRADRDRWPRHGGVRRNPSEEQPARLWYHPERGVGHRAHGHSHAHQEQRLPRQQAPRESARVHEEGGGPGLRGALQGAPDQPQWYWGLSWLDQILIRFYIN